MDSLEEEFHEEMLENHRRMEKAGHNASQFFQMVNEHRGLATAQYLLNEPDVSHRYRRLLEDGLLELTVEAIVIKEKWRPLFTPEQLETARGRLEHDEYDFEEQ